MLNRKPKTSQKSVDLLADWTWSFLNDHFGRLRRARPPVYLFLSDESAGSLSRRSPEEINFVRFIQLRDGGITLNRAPFIAYVSKLEQTVEETAHLYSLLRQPRPLPPEASEEFEENYSLLHETFGNCVQNLLMPLKLERRKKVHSLWDRIHFKAENLGRILAQRLFRGQIQFLDIAKCLEMDWHHPRGSERALNQLLALCGKKLRQRA